jgi:hypothetical protein
MTVESLKQSFWPVQEPCQRFCVMSWQHWFLAANRQDQAVCKVWGDYDVVSLTMG